MFHLNPPPQKTNPKITKTTSDAPCVSFYSHSNMAEDDLRTKQQVLLTASTWQKRHKLREGKAPAAATAPSQVKVYSHVCFCPALICDGAHMRALHPDLCFKP